MTEELYFRQLLAGRDFAVGDAVALSMRNFTYAIGDRDTRRGDPGRPGVPPPGAAGARSRPTG